MNILTKLIILISITIFFNHSLFAKQPGCDELMGNKTALNVSLGLGKMYFSGYNHAKNSNVTYTKSKMKNYIKEICSAYGILTIEEIFAYAADTNFDIPKFSENKLTDIDEFFSHFHETLKENPTARKCLINLLGKQGVSFFEKKYKELEPLRKSQGRDFYSESMIDTVFAEVADKFWNFIEKKGRKCK